MTNPNSHGTDGDEEPLNVVKDVLMTNPNSHGTNGDEEPLNVVKDVLLTNPNSQGTNGDKESVNVNNDSNDMIHNEEDEEVEEDDDTGGEFYLEKDDLVNDRRKNLIPENSVASTSDAASCPPVNPVNLPTGLSLDQGWVYAKRRLLDLGLEISPSQNPTPGLFY